MNDLQADLKLLDETKMDREYTLDLSAPGSTMYKRYRDKFGFTDQTVDMYASINAIDYQCWMLRMVNVNARNLREDITWNYTTDHAMNHFKSNLHRVYRGMVYESNHEPHLTNELLKG